MRKLLVWILAITVLLSIEFPAVSEEVDIHVKCEYSNIKGNMSYITYLGNNGQPAPCVYGYSIAECQYDGNKRWPEKIRYLNQDGEKCDTTQGYAVVRYSYNGNRKVTRITFYSTAGDIAMTSQGYASLAIYYSQDGERERVSAFNVRGKKIYTMTNVDVSYLLDDNGHPVLMGMPFVDLKEGPRVRRTKPTEELVDATADMMQIIPDIQEEPPVESMTPPPETPTFTPSPEPETPTPSSTPEVTPSPVLTETTAPAKEPTEEPTE